MARLVPPVLVLLSLATMIVWGVSYAGTDLWWDEITSLVGYALEDVRTIVTTYPEPNNHVLFNLIDHGLIHLWGISDLGSVMEHVARFRWAQWFVALGAVIYVVAAGRVAFGCVAGALSGLLLVTTLPFLNFSMQLRGYNLGLFFVAGLLFHAWNLRERSSVWHVGAVVLHTFGLLYVLPSNVYVALSFCGCAVVALCFGLPARSGTVRSSLPVRLLRNPTFWLLAAIGTGAVLALLAYLPIVDEILNNRFVDRRPAERAFILSRRLPYVLDHFLSYRYGILLVAIPGILLALRERALRVGRLSGRGRELPGSTYAWPLLVLLLLPFLLSFLRHDGAFERTFLPLAPVFALLLGAGSCWAVDSFRSWSPNLRAGVVLAVGVYALVTAGFAYFQVQGRLLTQFEESLEGEQNILANSYQSRVFQPSECAEWLAPQVGRHPGPVLLVREADRVASSRYLQERGVYSYSLTRIFPAEGESRQGGMTHTAHFQWTKEKGEDLVFFGANLSLPGLLPDDELSPVLQAVHRYQPSVRYYVVTDFPSWLPQLRQTLPLGWSWDVIRETGGFGTVLVIEPPA